MPAVVVYESMYGNTRVVAEAIAEGIRDAVAIPVAEAAAHPERVASASLLVVGGPTHAFSMSRPQTRASAAQTAAKHGSTRHLEPGATGAGIREWVAALPPMTGSAAAFDTRIAHFGGMGHAAPRIARGLRRHGLTLLCPPRSFFVTKNDTLTEGQLDAAFAWGAALATQLGLAHTR